MMTTHYLNPRTGLYDRRWWVKVLPMRLLLWMFDRGFIRFPLAEAETK